MKRPTPNPLEISGGGWESGVSQSIYHQLFPEELLPTLEGPRRGLVKPDQSLRAPSLMTTG